MSFLDDVKKNIHAISNTVGRETKKAIQATKKELEVQKLKYDINQEYKKLGEHIYLNRQTDSIDEILIDEICSEITEKLNKINEINGEISTEPEVNTNMEIIRPEKNEEGYYVMKFCHYCQVGNHPEAEYCINCGRKF